MLTCFVIIAIINNMINNELGSMPEDMLDAFVTSPEFELYKSIGEKYGE